MRLDDASKTSDGTYKDNMERKAGSKNACLPQKSQLADRSTVVIRKLPHDVHERELRNFLVFLPGYKSSHLSQTAVKDQHTEGIAVFESPAYAQDAAARVHGMHFDENCVLEAQVNNELDEKSRDANEIATINLLNTKLKLHEYRKNEKESLNNNVEHERNNLDKKPSEDDKDGVSVDETDKRAMENRMNSIDNKEALEQQPHAIPQSGPGFAVATAGPPVGGLMPVPMASPMPLAAFPPARAYAPVKNEKDNPPINTLFIGNLGENVDEAELLAVFGSQPGFVQLKLVHSSKGTSAFVEFADVASAHLCHDSQQGLILSTSDRGPIRVQFSKNPFGRKKDGSSGGLSSLANAHAAGFAPGGPQAHAIHTFTPGGPAFVTIPQPMMPGAYTATSPYAIHPVPPSVYAQNGVVVTGSSEMRDG